ncbi:RING-H2 finger protein ATL54-like [Cornus florida]|uniref:RING-H2 finger protein ATL54-like n=1 Tax=Cornus florida TaxID=4283 RepID=UPI00289C5EF3|nr:RING-H2 finger protein ATL54-like [Cornus florida]
MAFHYRRLLVSPIRCNDNQNRRPPRNPPPSPPSPSSLPPPLPPPPSSPPPLCPRQSPADHVYPCPQSLAYPQHHKNNQISLILIIMLCLLGLAVLFVGYFLLVLKYFSDLTNSRRRNFPIFEETREDSFDEDQGPVIDHPIWYINTVGLQQSIIDSITLFKYKRDDKLIEGTECSVCLNEFQEDECLRLLPKCSHAFHIPCIDTWLRSHKNCPLCRALIVCDTNHVHVSTGEPNSSDLGSREEDDRVENVENYGGLGSHGLGEDETSETRVGAESSGALPIEEGPIAEALEKDLHHFGTKSCGVRVLSDLADHRPIVEQELQPVRRSVSMDSSSAATIYRAMANIPPVEHEGCSGTMSVQEKKPNLEVAAKRVNKSSSKFRLNSSFGSCMQKGHVSMKRSLSSGRKFSSGRKYFQSRISRSHDSIPPL